MPVYHEPVNHISSYFIPITILILLLILIVSCTFASFPLSCYVCSNISTSSAVARKHQTLQDRSKLLIAEQSRSVLHLLLGASFSRCFLLAFCQLLHLFLGPFSVSFYSFCRVAIFSLCHFVISFFPFFV